MKYLDTSKETKDIRKQQLKRNRKQAKTWLTVDSEGPDPVFRKTQGYISW